MLLYNFVLYPSMFARVTLVILATTMTMAGLPNIMTTSLLPTATAQSNTTTTNSTTTTALPSTSSSNKIFYLFTAEHDGVNETKLGVPPDTFLTRCFGGQ